MQKRMELGLLPGGRALRVFLAILGSSRITHPVHLLLIHHIRALPWLRLKSLPNTQAWEGELEGPVMY